MIDQPSIEKIREILLRKWDPCGVGDNPYVADEYDSFLPGIMRMIARHCSAEELSEHLARLENEMGAPVTVIMRVETVKALLQLDR